MSDIKDWSTTAADNNAAAPNGAPEGWAPSSVNNVVRENMRAVRAFYAAIEWREFGDNTGTNDCHTVAYASATTFTTAAGDGDTTAVYHAGRRIRAVGSLTGTIYGVITASTGNPTTVTVSWDSGSLSSEALTISLGPGITGSPIYPGSGAEGQHVGYNGTYPVWKSGGWELVAEFEPSADASFTIHHAGFDGTPTNMLADYSYLVKGYIYGGTDSEQLISQFYEDVTGTPTLRNSADDYARNHVGHSNGVSAVSGTTSTSVKITGSLYGTSIDAAVHFEFFVEGIESGIVTVVNSYSAGDNNSGTFYQFADRGYCSAVGSTSATRKLDYLNVFPSSGTCTGKLKLYRQKGV